MGTTEKEFKKRISYCHETRCKQKKSHNSFTNRVFFCLGFEQRLRRGVEQSGRQSWSADGDPLLGSKVHEPGVPLRADEGVDDQEDGVHPRCHGQVSISPTIYKQNFSMKVFLRRFSPITIEMAL